LYFYAHTTALSRLTNAGQLKGDSFPVYFPKKKVIARSLLRYWGVRAAEISLRTLSKRLRLIGVKPSLPPIVLNWLRAKTPKNRGVPLLLFLDKHVAFCHTLAFRKQALIPYSSFIPILIPYP
jgi:hypothetical protein